MKNILIGSVKQNTFAHESFEPTIGIRYGVILGEGEGECYWFVRVLLLFHLKKMTALNPDDAEFVFLRHFDLTPPLHNVDMVSYCVCLARATGDEFDHLSTTIRHRLK